MNFTHLHLHTEFSLQDSSLRIRDLVKKAADYKMHSVAITDHGSLFGIIEFYKECKKYNINPIIGLETYVAPNLNTSKIANVDDANYHLVLLAKNNTGLNNLIQIASDASVNGFYYKPRTDKEKLRKYSDGLIATSACIAGEVQKHILKDDIMAAKRIAIEYNDIFGQDNFYLELQDHGMEEQRKANRVLIDISRDTNIPLICSNDCHYLDNEDNKPHDILMAIQGKTTIYDTKRKIYSGDQFYFKSQSEMYKVFSYIPEAIENTDKIAKRCNVEIEFGKIKLPKFDIPDCFSNAKEYLHHLVYKGAKKLYKNVNSEKENRIKYELDVIEKMGYIDYFLITWDFIRFARDNGILVGPGRGSAAGSIVSYCLFITRIDPIKYDLLFERFLDPSRISMPDIDIDFQDDRRHEVIDYAVKKYGRNSICQIITFSRMAARAAVRAVGRALNIPYSESDSVAKMVPMGLNIKEAISVNKDLLFKYENNNKTREFLDYAMSLEGLPLHISTHAAGVLITDNKGVNAHVPTWSTDKGIVAQFNMEELEELGLLKMDFLGLKTLTVISNTIKHVKMMYDIDIDLDKLYEIKDLNPLRLMGDGYTEGIFQLEGGGMTSFMMELKPKNIEEVFAGISLYRPGPMQYIPKYIQNKRDNSKIKYVFDKLESILKETYGVLVYQEQCMKIVIELAGYKRSQSDSFRKAISKKKANLIEMHEQYFINGKKEDEDSPIKGEIPGGINLGYEKDDLVKLYEDMKEFGKYAFNKSHAASYAFIGYCTAYLKYYYPTEFMCALMDSKNDDKDKIAIYMKHCIKDIDIKILPPNINESEFNFKPLKNKKIMYSLSAKNIDTNSLKLILLERNKNGKFKSMDDFFYRCRNDISKKTLEALVSIGAFDEFKIKKSSYHASIFKLMNALTKVKNVEKRSKNIEMHESDNEIIVDLNIDEDTLKLLNEYDNKTKRSKKQKPFVFSEKFKLDELLVDLKEFPENIILKLEKKYLGLYLSGHPLNRFKSISNKINNFNLKNLEYSKDDDGNIILNSGVNVNAYNNTKVKLVIIINEMQEIITRVKTKMARLNIEDINSSVNAIIFPQNYEEYKNILKYDGVYEIDGQISCKEDDEPTIFINKISSLIKFNKRIILVVNNEQDYLDFIRIIEDNRIKGSTPIYIMNKNKSIEFLLKEDFWVDLEYFYTLLNKNESLKEKIYIY